MNRALPAFDRNGNLPPGVYTEELGHIGKRFGWNSQRRKLLEGLKRAVRNLAAAGVKEIWIDGSFVTAKELPADIDGVWLVKGDVNLDKLDRVFLEFDEIDPTTSAMKKKYGVDFIIVNEELANPNAENGGVLAYFQKDRDGNRKGIIKIDIPKGSSE